MEKEMAERLENRLKEIRSAKTPEDLSFAIWSKEFEAAMGSSRQSYRDCLVEWVTALKEKRPPNLWNKYTNPLQVAQDIWKPFLNQDKTDEIWFGSLINEFVSWVNNYIKDGK